MLNLHRHDLLFLTNEGRLQAFLRRNDPQPEDHALWDQFPVIPAICKTQSGAAEKDWVEVGFSFPTRVGSNRKRISSQIPQSEIRKIYTPWQTIRLVTAQGGVVWDMLRQLRYAAESRQLHFGLFGSAALEAVTGLPYLHDRSDIDAILGPGSESAIHAFWDELLAVEQTTGVRADVELMFSPGKYIKLRELMSGGSTVLVKGQSEPQLLLCREIWASMSHG